MLISPKFDNYRNGELVKFISNVLSVNKQYDLNKLQLSSQDKALQDSYAVLTDIYKEDRGKKKMTEDITALDDARDNAFMGMRTILNAYSSYSPHARHKENADELLSVLDRHGKDIVRKSYLEQSAAMDDIIQKIEGDDTLLNHLRSFGVKFWYDRLKEATISFDQKYLERNKEYSKAPKEKLQELRKLAEDKFRELSKYISAYALINEGTDYNAYIDELNSLVEQSNQTVSNRQVVKEEEVIEEISVS